MRFHFRSIVRLLGAVFVLGVVTFVGTTGLFARNDAVTSILATSLTDLGGGLYKGKKRGLYPGGTNVRPQAHAAAGVQLAQSVLPRNAAGGVDLERGLIVFLAIGMSHTRMEFEAFKKRAEADPFVSSRVVFVNGAQGGKDARLIANPADPYWAYVNERLAEAGVTAAQVQAVWLKEAVRKPTLTFPESALELRGFLEAICGILNKKFPFNRLAFLSGRSYGGYSDAGLANPEPHAYESGFAVKWLIQDQISGKPSLNFDPGAGPVRSPWLSWGPYFWTDGLAGRADGLKWEARDTQQDGLHPSQRGCDKVTRLLMEFLRSDAASSGWFLQDGNLPEFPAESEPNGTTGQADEIADGYTTTGALAAGESDVFAFRGLQGQSVRVRAEADESWVDLRIAVLGTDGVTVLRSDRDDGDMGNATAGVTLPANGRYFVRISGDTADTAGTYLVTIRKENATGVESEPNGSWATATPIADEANLAATIGAPGDEDFFAFAAPPGTGFDIQVETFDGTSPAERNLRLALVNSQGDFLLQDDDSGTGLDPALAGILPPAAGGAYGIRIGSRNPGDGDAGFRYRVRLRLSNVKLDLTPVVAGPRLGPTDALRFWVTCRNRSRFQLSGVLLTVVAQGDNGGVPVLLLSESLASSAPRGWGAQRRIQLKPPLGPGRYRLRATLSTDGSDDAAQSFEFEIGSP